MISTAFSVIAMYQAISLSKAMTTQNWVSFALEMLQFGLATASIITASLGESDVSRSLMGAKMALMGVQQLMGSMDGYF